MFWLWSADGRFHTIKRGFDILGSLFLLPVMLAIGLVLLVANPLWNQGPLFFTQRRVGRNGVPFAMVKFRTVDAQGRVSSFAAWLRARRVDEVPQVFNVLAGEMSLIGPRPEQPDYVAAYAFKLPGYMSRHETLYPLRQKRAFGRGHPSFGCDRVGWAYGRAQRQRNGPDDRAGLSQRQTKGRCSGLKLARRLASAILAHCRADPAPVARA